MTTAVAILKELSDRGVAIVVKQDKLVVTAPFGILTEQVKSQLVAHKLELIAILGRGVSPENETEPDGECRHCGCALFWRENGGPWRCFGCDYPEDVNRISNTLSLPVEHTELCRQRFEARSCAATLINDIGARLFETEKRVVVAIPRDADSIAVREAIHALGIRRVVYLDDPEVPARRGAAA